MEEEYTTDPAILFDYSHHNVKDLFDLFTSKFGQPGSPSYSRFNVTKDYIEIVTYYLDENDNPKVFNTIRVKNSRHDSTQNIENIKDANTIANNSKFISNGQLYIVKDGRIYNVIGQKIAQ